MHCILIILCWTHCSYSVVTWRQFSQPISICWTFSLEGKNLDRMQRCRFQSKCANSLGSSSSSNEKKMDERKWIQKQIWLTISEWKWRLGGWKWKFDEGNEIRSVHLRKWDANHHQPDDIDIGRWITIFHINRVLFILFFRIFFFFLFFFSMKLWRRWSPGFLVEKYRWDIWYAFSVASYQWNRMGRSVGAQLSGRKVSCAGAFHGHRRCIGNWLPPSSLECLWRVLLFSIDCQPNQFLSDVTLSSLLCHINS